MAERMSAKRLEGIRAALPGFDETMECWEDDETVYTLAYDAKMTEGELIDGLDAANATVTYLLEACEMALSEDSGMHCAEHLEDVIAKAKAGYDGHLLAAAPDMLAALEQGNAHGENGPALLRRVASVVLSIGLVVTAAELCAKADAEEAAIAWARGEEAAGHCRQE